MLQHKDVAIISLETPVPANMANVRPVCLPNGQDDYAEQTATVVGWGSLRENGPQPDSLMEVTVRIWDNPTCKVHQTTELRMQIHLILALCIIH